MPAFTYGRFNEVRIGLCMMYHRSISYKHFYLTYKQTRKLFLDPDHYEILDKAKELFQVYGESAFNFPMLGQKFTATGGTDGGEDYFPFPNYMGTRRFVEPDDPVIQKLEEWCRWRLRLAADFTAAIAVLEALNEECPSASILNYLWPSIVPILRMLVNDEWAVKLSVKLSDSKAQPANVPSFSPEFKRAANEAAGVVARTQMITNEHDKNDGRKGSCVQIGLTEFRMECPWEPMLGLLSHHTPLEPQRR